MSSQKYRVIDLYKTLLFMGRDYPLGYNYFRTRCHRAFLKNKDERDPEKVEKLIKHGEYIVNELQALYMLKKYRTLKRNYYNEQIDARYVDYLNKINDIEK